MSGTHIPFMQRRLVEVRDNKRCVRCKAHGTEWHHRRGRAVGGEHKHCTCNGVLLCHVCHHWVHKYPDKARLDGLIVSRYVSEPEDIPIKMYDGWWILDCTGGGVAIPTNLVSLVGEAPKLDILAGK